ncbi:MAG: LuxE/PaaK family acyltransferase [Candidatus Thorarchaeota archaeon]
MDSEKVGIESIIANEQYQIPQEEKEHVLLPFIRKQVKNSMESSPALKKFYSSYNSKPEEIESLTDLAPIPVTMFKTFNLQTCSDEQIVRTLKSSATTTGIPSKIPIDKTTAMRQTRALVASLKSFLGTARRPFLVMDTSEVNDPSAASISARGAAVRGISSFSRKTVYVMDNIDGELHVNFERLQQFVEDYGDKEVLGFGFTYIIWTRFLQALKEKGMKLDIPNIKILHGGGWKKLISQAVTKEKFNKDVGALFNTDPHNVLDYYGMVEQLGVLFVDCSEGHKHIPDFADVIIRDIFTMEEAPVGVPGLIEILSTIATSYPSQGLLTEDVGEVIGIDDCPCGRKGKYFEFRARAEKAETRGCGDTFAERRGD